MWFQQNNGINAGVSKTFQTNVGMSDSQTKKKVEISIIRRYLIRHHDQKPLSLDSAASGNERDESRLFSNVSFVFAVARFRSPVVCLSLMGVGVSVTVVRPCIIRRSISRRRWLTVCMGESGALRRSRCTIIRYSRIWCHGLCTSESSADASQNIRSSLRCANMVHSVVRSSRLSHRAPADRFSTLNRPRTDSA